MKPLRATVAFLAVAIPLAAACADPCEDLATVCSFCPDRSYQEECLAIVAKGNHGVCSADVAIFRAQCPVPPSVTATSGATTTAATAGASTTGTGAGGAATTGSGAGGN